MPDNKLNSTGCVRQEVHRYTISLSTDDPSTGETKTSVCEVNIYFKDNLFDGVSFDLPGRKYGSFRRNEWKILALIAEKITELEQQKI